MIGTKRLPPVMLGGSVGVAGGSASAPRSSGTGRSAALMTGAPVCAPRDAPEIDGANTDEPEMEGLTSISVAGTIGQM